MSTLFEDPDYPEVLEAVAAAVASQLKDKGIHGGLAEECGRAAAERVRNDFGGAQLYVPVGRFYKLSQRDNAIYDEWRPGLNERELMQRYEITERHLRRIIEARRAEDRAKRQGQLSV